MDEGSGSGTSWRPPPGIRAIAIGIIRRGNAIFVFEGRDPTESQPFYRPPGGGINAGELGAEAVIREFAEEFDGAQVVEPRYLGTLENLFTFAGVPGHEIVLVYETSFADGSMDVDGRIAGREETGEAFEALWLDLDRARSGAVPLYPDGLLELLEAHR
jgi:ADP-ribose pyrophosphatase YjhB (NUDIX family)